MSQQQTSNMRSVLRFKQLVLSALAVAILITPLLAVSAHGQASNANAADGLQISPAIIEVNGEPGKTYTVQIRVTNVTASDLSFDSTVNDFTSKDESGAPSIDFDGVLPASASIRSWVGVIDNFTLEALESKTIPVTLSIPNNAEPGGHYGVIRFSGRAPTIEGSGVGLAASAGSLVLVKVAGAVEEDLELLTFQTAQNNTWSGIFKYGPVDFVMRFGNKGNVHVKPIGQIEIRDMFGNKVDTLEINTTRGNVLPNSIRKFQSTLDKQWMFGRYTADLSVAYGTTGQAIVKSIDFWVIPYRLIVGAIILLATLIFISRAIIKRYNSYIIKRAHSSHGHKTKNRKK
jgi:hypothetical protein